MGAVKALYDDVNVASVISAVDKFKLVANDVNEWLHLPYKASDLAEVNVFWESSKINAYLIKTSFSVISKE